jgi:hypothetical protein
MRGDQAKRWGKKIRQGTANLLLVCRRWRALSYTGAHDRLTYASI